MIKQSSWRKVGAVTIGTGAIMAIYAVATDLLRDSILYALELFSVGPASSDVTPSMSPWFLGVYWIVFLGLIGAAMYCAVLDFGHIRMEYALDKREIFGKTLGDSEFRKTLLKRSGEKE